MTGQLSEDGQWMWDGEQWIPAPPREQNKPNSVPEQSVVSNASQLSYTPSAPPGKGSSSGYTSDAERPQSVITTTLSNRPKMAQVNSFAIEVISKKWFPSASIHIGFTNPTTGIHHKIKITQVVRSFSAEDDSGSKVGKIKMKGFTIFSGAGGNITLSDGGVFKVDMKTFPFGINKKSFTLTDLSNGTVFRTY
jgi:hypothetical protein